MNERRQLGADEVRRLFADLGRRLHERGIEATLYVVGGAAMALTHNSRRVTADVDALSRPASEVYEVAKEMAGEHRLTESWLSGNAGAWVPDLPVGWEEDGIDFAGLRVVVASAEVLLAMKMIAERDRDVDDLIVLFRTLEITDPQQAVDIVHRMYPHGLATRLPEDADMLLDAAEIIHLARQ